MPKPKADHLIIFCQPIWILDGTKSLSNATSGDKLIDNLIRHVAIVFYLKYISRISHLAEDLSTSCRFVSFFRNEPQNQNKGLSK